MKEIRYINESENCLGPVIVFDYALCDGCNACVRVCRQHILLPNPEKGSSPLIINREECWFDGCCVLACPKGAIKLIHPLVQRVGWKRKETGEYFRIGMKNPPYPNTRSPVG